MTRTHISNGVEYKRCSICKIDKPVSDFHKSSKRAGARTLTHGFIQSRCKHCQNVDKVEIRRRNLEHMQRIKMASGCVRCGFNDAACALDFHHVKEKSFAVTGGKGMLASIETLNSELAKCVVLCANCHRIHHAESRKEQQ